MHPVFWVSLELRIVYIILRRCPPSLLTRLVVCYTRLSGSGSHELSTIAHLLLHRSFCTSILAFLRRRLPSMTPSFPRCLSNVLSMTAPYESTFDDNNMDELHAEIVDRDLSFQEKLPGPATNLRHSKRSPRPYNTPFTSSPASSTCYTPYLPVATPLLTSGAKTSAYGWMTRVDTTPRLSPSPLMKSS